MSCKSDAQEIPPSELELYYQAKQITLPTQVPASAGGLNKTSKRCSFIIFFFYSARQWLRQGRNFWNLDWELEIRKRYAQPLASETGEFPDADSIYARMVPICYEESVASGAGFPCAEFMAIATETFIKQVLSSVFSRTRHNGPSGTINGMMTRKYRQQLEREELAFTRGEITKDLATGLLPVEAKEASIRQPLGSKDLRLALSLGGALLGQMPLVVNEIFSSYDEDELELERQGYIEELRGQPGTKSGPAIQTGATSIVASVAEINGIDSMDIDDEWEWEGGAPKDRDQLNSLLDECLALAAA